MPVRALLYDGLGYLKECNEFRNIHKAEHDFDSDTGFLSGMNKSDRIHPIITLIFYYGESSWDGPVTLSGMMTDIPEELRPFFSDYKINLVQILDSGHYQFYNEDVRSVFDITQKILPFPIKPYPTGREILPNRALPYFTKCVESLVLLTCMKHIWE